ILKGGVFGFNFFSLKKKKRGFPGLCFFGVCSGARILKTHSGRQIFAASFLSLGLVDDFYILTT
ncbi:hypothetical protein KCA24_31145, partial [Escherichia coli]|nr:hypothetical protein [Escherichia coli]